MALKRDRYSRVHLRARLAEPTWMIVSALGVIASFALALWGIEKLGTRDPVFAGEPARRLAEWMTFQLPLRLASDVPAEVYAASWLLFASLPVLVLMVLLRIARRPLDEVIARYEQDHVVLCASGEVADVIAGSLADSGRRVVLLRDPTDRESTKRQDITVVHGLASRPESLTACSLSSASKLIIAQGDDYTNLSIVVAAETVLRATASRVQNLDAIVEIRDAGLRATVLRSRNLTAPEPLAVSAFSRERYAVRLLMRGHPPHRYGDIHRTGRAHCLIVGASRQGEELLFELLRSAHYGERGPRLTLIVPDAAGCELALRERLPALDLIAEFRCVSWAPGQALDGLRGCLDGVDAEPLAGVYVCIDDPRAAFEALSRMVEVLRERGAHIPPLFVESIDGEGWLIPFARDVSAGASPELVPIGSHQEVFSLEILLREQLDDIAKAVHGRYAANEEAKGSKLDAVRPWEQLPETYREANRHVADHLAMKLCLGGLALEPLARRSTAAISPSEIESMARVEHSRWCAERAVDGWVHGAVRDNARKRHPDLVAFDALSQEDQEKDREKIREITQLFSSMGYSLVRERPVAVIVDEGADNAAIARLVAAVEADGASHPDEAQVLVLALVDAESARIGCVLGEQLRLPVWLLLPTPLYSLRTEAIERHGPSSDDEIGAVIARAARLLPLRIPDDLTSRAELIAAFMAERAALLVVARGCAPAGGITARASAAWLAKRAERHLITVL